MHSMVLLNLYHEPPPIQHTGILMRLPKSKSIIPTVKLSHFNDSSVNFTQFSSKLNAVAIALICIVAPINMQSNATNWFVLLVWPVHRHITQPNTSESEKGRKSGQTRFPLLDVHRSKCQRDVNLMNASRIQHASLDCVISAGWERERGEKKMQLKW